jgi:pimeloyl-ACP methyl ester carboxylesterase
MDPRFISRTVTANNQRIHLVEAGEGPMVLFVHGFPELWYSWRHQLSGSPNS